MEQPIKTLNQFRSHVTAALGRGEIEYALRIATEAAARYAACGDPPGEATARYLIGLGRRNQDDVPAAVEAFRASAWLWESAGDKRGLADSLNAWAISLLQRSGHLEALPLIERSASLYAEIGDEVGQARTCVNLGAVYKFLGDVDAAREVLDRALRLYEAVGDQKNIGKVLLNIAGAYNVLDRPADAIRFGERGLALFQARGDSGNIATAHNILGNACLHANDLAAALDHFRAALDIMPQHGYAYLRAATFGDIGDALVRQGRFDEARDALEQSLAANGAVGNTAVRGNVLGRLATLHANADFEAHDDTRALALLLEARQLMEASGGITELAPIYTRLTEIYERRGDYKEALACQRMLFDSQKRLFNEESDRRIKVLEIRFEVEKARKDAEIAHLRSVELANALAEAERLRALADEQARTDALTGVYNRRYFDERFVAEFERSERHSHPLSVAILDIDHFKRINDTFGHAVGDATLCRLAAMLRNACRGDDTVARFGGEEFALLMPETELVHARIMCERLRARIEAVDWSAVAPGLGRVTASIGISAVDSLPDTVPRTDAGAAILEAADRNLYIAKASGRNRVVSEGEG